jgi:hypothetical protein
MERLGQLVWTVSLAALIYTRALCQLLQAIVCGKLKVNYKNLGSFLMKWVKSQNESPQVEMASLFCKGLMHEGHLADCLEKKLCLLFKVSCPKPGVGTITRWGGEGGGEPTIISFLDPLRVLIFFPSISKETKRIQPPTSPGDWSTSSKIQSSRLQLPTIVSL